MQTLSAKNIRQTPREHAHVGVLSLSLYLAGLACAVRVLRSEVKRRTNKLYAN